jgi:H/ACA ribonucleoprotein complex subunit 4
MRVVLPLEGLLMKLPRVVIKDSSIDVICSGAKLMILGVLRYDDNINMMIMVTKEETVPVAIAQMSTAEIGS